MNKVLLSGVAVLALSVVSMAGGKLTEEVIVPVVPVVKHDTSGLYVAGAAYYNNIYSEEYSWFNDAQDTQDEIGGFTAILGYNINEYLAVETRVSKEFFEEDYADEYHYGFFLKPQYRFRDKAHYEDNYFTVYGLLGFGYVNIEGVDGNTPGAPEIVGKTLTDDWQFQYGLGMSYTFVDTEHPESDSGDYSIFAEYTMYMDDQSIESTRLYDYNPEYYDKLSMNGLSIGVSYQF